MSEKINNRIDTVKEAWTNLTQAYRELGEKSGYAHLEREEDLRCFFFCKIMEVLQQHNEFLIDLHAEVSLSHWNVDIVLGFEGEEKCDLGIEIKKGGDIDAIRQDLEKLRSLMKSKNIRAGVFVTIVKHSFDLRKKLQEIISEYSLEEKDLGDNNFAQFNRMMVDKHKMDWDALLLVLRKA